MKKQELRALVENLGQKETGALGIDLSRETDEDFQMVLCFRALRSADNRIRRYQDLQAF